jgi:Mn2+/Fe2+ NRAMP family transporter
LFKDIQDISIYPSMIFGQRLWASGWSISWVASRRNRWKSTGNHGAMDPEYIKYINIKLIIIIIIIIIIIFIIYIYMIVYVCALYIYTYVCMWICVYIGKNPVNVQNYFIPKVQQLGFTLDIPIVGFINITGGHNIVWAVNSDMLTWKVRPFGDSYPIHLPSFCVDIILVAIYMFASC